MSDITKIVFGCILAALLFVWGMSVGKTDDRAGAYIDGFHACKLGLISE